MNSPYPFAPRMDIEPLDEETIRSLYHGTILSCDERVATKALRSL